MEAFLHGIEVALETLSQIGLAACQGGQRKELSQEDVGRFFKIRPLKNAGPEGQRATQQSARLLSEGRHEEALRTMHEAMHWAPNSREVFHNLASVCYHMGDEPGCFHWLWQAYQLAPFDDLVVIALAGLEQKRQRFERAQQLLIRFLQEVDEANVPVLKQLAGVYQEAGEWSRAAGCYHRLQKIDPKGAEWASELKYCLGKLPTARDPREEYVADPVGGGQGPRGFGMSKPVAKVAVSHPEDSVQDMLDEANHLLGMGKVKAALPLFESLHQRGELTLESPVLGGLMHCRQEMRDNQGALEVAHRLLHLQKSHAEANLTVAEILLEMKGFSTGIDSYITTATASIRQLKSKFSRGDEDDEERSRKLQLRLLCLRAEVALGQEDHKQALTASAEAIRLDVSEPKALLLLGQARNRVAEYAGALRVLGTARDALEALPPSDLSSKSRAQLAQVHCLMGQAHERCRQYAAAKSEIDKALKIDPNQLSALTVKAAVLHQTGHTREAEGLLWDYLDLDPDHVEARLLLGYIELCSGNCEGCVKTLEELDKLSLKGKILASQLGAAKAYQALAFEGNARNLGKPRLAEEHAERAVSLHKNLWHIWHEIANGVVVSNPLELVQRLRGICDLDLTSLQAKQLLRLLSRSSGRPELVAALASLAVPHQQSSSQQQHASPQQPQPSRGRYGGGGGGGGGSAGPSRQGSMPPPNRFATGDFDDYRGVAGSGTSTPNRESMGSLYRGSAPSRGSFLEGGAPGAWMRHGGSHSSTRPETPFSNTPHRGRSISPGYDGQALGSRGSFANANIPFGSRRSASATSSRDERADGDLSIGWSELITPEQLLFGPQLGTGGSAAVFRGSWHGQEVAIKKISGVGHLEEMKKEVNALRRLRHPRLVRFIGACLQPPQLLVVTEFMPGGSLHDRVFRIRQDGLSPTKFLMIAMQVAEGLGFLHGQRVVHRDLKSMNILLDALENAKICDFGLAQQMDLMATHIDRKMEGEGGSPRYMAPECYDASLGKMTEKVDIWAFGCILLEMYGGVLPYADCQTLTQLTTRILVERKPPAPPPQVPRPIADIIQRCGAFNPTKRPSAGELRGELAKLPSP